MDGRIGKQCRERWHNQLDPQIKKSVWTPEEDSVIYQAQQQMGNHWAAIAALLPGRYRIMMQYSTVQYSAKHAYTQCL